jgi:hypothetical protein
MQKGAMQINKELHPTCTIEGMNDIGNAVTM